MLSAIRAFMQERGTASLTELSIHLEADPGAVRGMIDVWRRKGRMVQLPLPCGGCTQCDTGTTEIYQWTEPASQAGGLSTDLKESAILRIAPIPTECSVLPSEV